MNDKYVLEGLLNSEFNAFAVTDNNLKIISFSNGFKKVIGAGRIKGLLLDNLLDLHDLRKSLPKKEECFSFNVSGKTLDLFLKPVKKQNTIQGYLAVTEPLQNSTGGNEPEIQIPDIQSEQQEILALLLKENSLNNMAAEILTRCTFISDSSFAIAVVFAENRNHEYIFHDPAGMIKKKEDIRSNISISLSFINKWFYINRSSLLASNSPSNIAFNLLKEFEVDSAVIAPCFFEDKLLGIIIEAKEKGEYTRTDIKNVEQIATLLSFAISSIRTRELKDTLESRLLQSQKLETIGKLSSGMAHDFSNLLSSIFGSLNLLKKRVQEREDINRLLDNIENCSIRAKDLTKGLLSFGKPTPKRKELIKPNILLGEISKVVNQTFPSKITFKTEIDEHLYDILGNGTEVYQVLLNLCVNAKEAMDEKGELSLRAQNITIDHKNITNHPLLDEGNYVWITVKDNGSGIEEENLNKIFDPYFSTKNKSTGSGSGLGLYVTYGIIKAHGGNIEVSSKINVGTSFDVFIPAYEPTKHLKKSTAEKIILLADDEIMLRDLLAELLESYGYNVIKVISGVEALRVLTEEIKVNLAIIDYNMPEMDGLECIRKIRELNYDIPVILSSGSIYIGEGDKFRDQGIDGVVSKPYEFETMLETIQKLI